ncbi:MAG: hypothetical protein O7A69_04325 [SAR324 cluster bacterium]|nr:hypothetical protein [SAR324 cluster bacterium]
MLNDYLSLSTRAGFNRSLGHFRMVTGIVGQLGKGMNLAEIIDDLEKEKKVEKSQIAPILNAVVIDRMQYATRSFNMPSDSQKFDQIHENTAKWNRFDLIVAYHHPQLGISLINPKSKEQWEGIQEVNREELIVCYCKGKRDQDMELEEEGLNALVNLIVGHDVQGMDKFHDAALDAQQAAPPPPPAQPAPQAQSASIPVIPPEAAPPAAAPSAPSAAPSGNGGEKQEAAAPPAGGGGKKRVTPKYSIQVTNELFHNGNVEAWKNIVESYKAKHLGLEVHIFHDGQKVNNINALFKWGKVKNGDVILFSVAGEEIKGVAKLQRYLFEGASLRFENYLKKDVNKILNLF